MKLNPSKKSSGNPRKYLFILCAVALLGIAGMGFATPILCSIGEFPVYDENPVPSDAVVVLYTGVEYYPRLIEAARLYNDGLAENIVINGNRKTDMLRSLEDKGFVSCCNWAEDYIRILACSAFPGTYHHRQRRGCLRYHQRSRGRGEGAVRKRDGQNTAHNEQIPYPPRPPYLEPFVRGKAFHQRGIRQERSL